MKPGWLRGRDLLTLQDYSSEEITQLLELSRRLKEDPSFLGEPLKGKCVALVFERPSTRTRVSLEVAISQLGGRALYLLASETQLSRGEAVGDMAKVMDRYVDAVAARVRSHRWLEEYARFSRKPVINALSDLHHPLQALADLLTIWEVKGRLRGIRLAYVGDGGANTCHSLLIVCSKLGVDVVVACPSQYRPMSSVLKEVELNALQSGSRVEVVEDPEVAVRGADVVYTDVFVSMGKEEEMEARRKVFLPRYQVRPELVKLAKDDYVFMHCLPAHRGEEVVDEVIDDPSHSVVWDQAENRLYTAKAVLASLI
ncbi:MAG: ornithine carbamoyltransferase [Candidatus Nezhaarchaeota archaeon]|nr:ornithine carbamoyltransferase [Candidatus Nezhaarchaeota archaeon]